MRSTSFGISYKDHKMLIKKDQLPNGGKRWYRVTVYTLGGSVLGTWAEHSWNTAMTVGREKIDDLIEHEKLMLKYMVEEIEKENARKV